MFSPSLVFSNQQLTYIKTETFIYLTVHQRKEASQVRGSTADNYM